MRLIDADAAIKDARANYGGVHDAVLMEHFLNTQPTITPPPNSPLTLEELREMDGEPVWLVPNKGMGNPEYALVNAKRGWIAKACLDFWEFSAYGKSIVAYRRKPEEGE